MIRRMRRALVMAELFAWVVASVVVAKLAAVLQASERDDEKRGGAP